MEYFIFRELLLPGYVLLLMSAVVFTLRRSTLIKLLSYVGTFILIALIALASHVFFIYHEFCPEFKQQICISLGICSW